jgi:hypothetical protein
MMRGDDEGEDWAKAAIQIALGALSLFPGTWVIALASVGLDLFSAGKAYVRYGLDKALVGTSLDRAKALSSKTPSLAGFAWALVGAGLNVAGARAAFGEAEALSARVLAGDAKAEKLLNELGESRGLPRLGEDVARTRPAASQPTLIPPRSTHVPSGEESVAGTGRRISPVDRGKGSRPFYAKDPKARKPPGGRPRVVVPTGPAHTPKLAEFKRRIENFKSTVTPRGIVGAPPPFAGGKPGHWADHGWSREQVAGLLNNPERTFSGVNRNGREVDVYWRDEDVVITVAGRKDTVITAYGRRSPRDPHPESAATWESNPAYVEIEGQQVSYHDASRFEADEWPPMPPAPSPGGAPPPPVADE